MLGLIAALCLGPGFSDDDAFYADTDSYLHVSGGTIYGDLYLDDRYMVAPATIAADDTTPDVSGASVFLTSDNTVPTAITDLDLPAAGQMVTICIGGTGANASTIADAGFFHLSGDWGATVDECITLYVLADNDYIEVSRTVIAKWVYHTMNAGAATLPPTAPTWDVNSSCVGLGFDADAEFAHLFFELPSCWDGASDPQLRVYWCPTSGDAPQDTETVKWDIRYRSIEWGVDDADNGTEATGTVTYTQSGAGDDKDTFISVITMDADGASQPIAVGDVLAVDFDRDLATDTYSGKGIVHHWELGFFTKSNNCDHY